MGKPAGWQFSCPLNTPSVELPGDLFGEITGKDELFILIGFNAGSEVEVFDICGHAGPGFSADAPVFALQFLGPMGLHAGG